MFIIDKIDDFVMSIKLVFQFGRHLGFKRDFGYVVDGRRSKIVKISLGIYSLFKHLLGLVFVKKMTLGLVYNCFGISFRVRLGFYSVTYLGNLFADT